MPLTIVDGRIVYRCSKCGVAGCKLWREYQTFLNHQELYCVRCACLDQPDKGAKPEDFDAGGYHPSKYRYDDGHEIDMGPTDQIGWLIPAVPTEEGDTFWGYSSVPEPLVRWWRSLPTQPGTTPAGV